jgi:flavin-dependent dehydrogenase
MDQRFDAVVIGAGPGGSTAAILLASAGWSVALAERAMFPRRKVCGEYLSATNLRLIQRLGVACEFGNAAGPPVKRVGLYAGDDILTADLPRHTSADRWGRALGREWLDTLLVRRARDVGATVRQPVCVRAIYRDGTEYVCATDDGGDLRTRVMIAAHGYWEPGPLPTQATAGTPRADDLFGFKAHFIDTRLPPNLMPLLAFPGGYGGMVHSDGGRVSLSCCIRRDRLASLRRLRRDHGSATAVGNIVLEHILDNCRGARAALDGAGRNGPWLAAGPLRPGIRVRPAGGTFAVGNAAGEAHPVVAEGISMAMQAAWLLTKLLIAAGPGKRDWRAVGLDYAAAWRRAFAPRVRTATVCARWAMRPAAVASMLPLLRLFPGLLKVGARLSGKARNVVN